jgi:hypothetical protein
MSRSGTGLRDTAGQAQSINGLHTNSFQELKNNSKEEKNGTRSSYFYSHKIRPTAGSSRHAEILHSRTFKPRWRKIQRGNYALFRLHSNAHQVNLALYSAKTDTRPNNFISSELIDGFPSSDSEFFIFKL